MRLDSCKDLGSTFHGGHSRPCVCSLRVRFRGFTSRNGSHCEKNSPRPRGVPAVPAFGPSHCVPLSPAASSKERRDALGPRVVVTQRQWHDCCPQVRSHCLPARLQPPFATVANSIEPGDLHRAPLCPEQPSKHSVVVSSPPPTDRTLIETDGPTVATSPRHIAPRDLQCSHGPLAFLWPETTLRVDFEESRGPAALLQNGVIGVEGAQLHGAREGTQGGRPDPEARCPPHRSHPRETRYRSPRTRSNPLSSTAPRDSSPMTVERGSSSPVAASSSVREGRPCSG